MIAIIYDAKTQSTYVSPIFAIKRYEAIAFNADRSGIKKIKRWAPDSFYIISKDDLDHKNGKWRGYDWVLKNEELFRALKFGKTASLDDFPEFKKYDGEIILPEWFEVKDGDDIAVLEDVADLVDGVNYSPREDSVLPIRVKTGTGSYVNIRLIDVFEESPAESMDHIAGIGIERDENGFIFIYEEKQIKCRSIMWNIEVILQPYLRLHRNYPDISALYEDISLEDVNAELIDGKLIINARERIEAELKNGEYVITVDGKREPGSVEDQDIYYHLLEYVYGGQLPPPAWKYSHGRFVSLINGIKFSLIPTFFAVLLFAATVMSDSKAKLIFFAIFSGISWFIVFMTMSMTVSDKIAYEIQDSVFIIHRPGASEILPLAAVKEVSLKRSRIFRNRATVKLKTDDKNYYFRFVKGADEAYTIIRERINNKE